MIDIFSIPVVRGKDAKGVPKVKVNPHEMYPVVLDRIKEALTAYRKLVKTEGHKGAMTKAAPELVTTPERGGEARCWQLMEYALSLAPEAWDDALIPRDEFYPDVPYWPKPKLPSYATPEWVKVKLRGDALEVAMGWYLHATRVKIGGFLGEITTGLTQEQLEANPDIRPPWRL